MNINLNEIITRMNGDSSRTVELLLISLNEFPKWKVNFKNAAAESDFKNLEKLAHTYKGSCAPLAMENARSIFLSIEQCARDKNISQINTLLAEAWIEITEVESQIKAYIENNQNCA